MKSVDLKGQREKKVISKKLYIASVHFENSKWIEIQKNFLNQYLEQTAERHLLLINIDSMPLEEKRTYLYKRDQGSHAQNLNFLAEQIVKRSESDSDIIIFLDGDAFPINNLKPLIDQVLSENRPAAVQRLENNGDCQPHPCFAIFTVGMWKKYSGDWSSGYQWQNPQGDLVTDVGGEMLKIFQERKIDWIKLKRTNNYNLHPLLFGVYGDVVYHHGAAFRPNDGGRITRVQHKYKEKLQRVDAKIIEKITPKKYRQRIRNSIIHPAGRLYHKLVKENSKLTELVYQQIKRDPDYVYTFIN